MQKSHESVRNRQHGKSLRLLHILWRNFISSPAGRKVIARLGAVRACLPAGPLHALAVGWNEGAGALTDVVAAVREDPLVRAACPQVYRVDGAAPDLAAVARAVAALPADARPLRVHAAKDLAPALVAAVQVSTLLLATLG